MYNYKNSMLNLQKNFKKLYDTDLLIGVGADYLHVSNSFFENLIENNSAIIVKKDDGLERAFVDGMEYITVKN